MHLTKEISSLAKVNYNPLLIIIKNEIAFIADMALNKNIWYVDCNPLYAYYILTHKRIILYTVLSMF